ncbi:EF hand domain protein [Pseudomonas chlororaphis subsp. piscium]|uniref:hypothetical protein n=1 Tax=Pseudomonas chlororaphis TaxID=587753 RepID=UPI000879A37E|nr:hypothetical protein [Pseudomonas chlororaphis]AZC34257.1 EF hand domain protein [Pseudomonas chlororaphis subsp. piscium]WDG91885.1 hypothetical protein PUP49_00290 [Pseudomonas chlororaphis]SDS03926.1 hypothetical protein SAMN05216585_1037 [Pseudomonas chlororaphis]
MSSEKYEIVESVGKTIRNVTSFSSLAKHHPSSGQEKGRDYEVIDGHNEEIRKSKNGPTLIKKDFVLKVNGSIKGVEVPAPISGYVKTSINYGAVKIYDAPTGGRLIGQALHLDTKFKVKDGQYIEYGQPIGIQSGVGVAGKVTYAVHSHIELEKAQFEKYIADIVSGVIRPGVAPKGSSTGTAKNTSIEGYQFPFRKPDDQGYKSADEIYEVLQKETSGHYLLSAHGFWHGGIHISDKSAPQCVRETPIRCIGDGEVVAYRLNESHLTSEFVGSNDCASLKYSTSFCLVRHEYKSPKKKTAEGEKGGGQNCLTFYSLYMHLLPFKDYSVKEVDLKRKVKAVNGGWLARSLPLGKEGSEVFGNIPTGTEFEILKEENSADGKYKFAYGRITKGSFSNKKIDDCVWFAIEENGEAIKDNKGSNRLQDIPPRERTTPGYWHGTVKATVTTLQGLKVRGAPIGEKGGPQLAPQQVLCTGSTIEFDSAKIKWLTLEDGERYPMAECKFIPGDGAGLKGEGVLPPTFWCCVSDTGAKPFITRKGVVPSRFDSVVLTNTAIKAGEPIGYMGLYESPASAKGGVNSKHQVHVEIFSADSGLESFLKNPAGILDGKKYIIVSKGQKLASKGGSSEKPVFAEQTAPLENKLIVALGQAKKIKDAEGKEWFELTTPGPEKKIAGYISKEKCEIVCQHDWEKLGFTVVKENSQNADGFLDPEQMPKFFQELYKEVDSNGDNNITPGELQASLRDTAIRDKWSKLIGYHPTEWQAKSSEPKWARIKDLLKDTPDLLKHEQGRIDKLVFWDELAGAMQVSLPKQIYHFHPIAFVNNLMKVSVPGKGWAHSAFADLLASVESSNDYTAYNKTKGGKKSFYKTNLTDLTIAELQQKQAVRDIFAAGRYQMIPDTINGAVKKLGLDTSLKFDEVVQDKIFEEYLIKVKRKAFIQYLEGDGDVERAIYAWALEFASAGVRKGKPISSIPKRDKNNKIVMEADGVTPVMLSRVASFEGQSYYAGDGLNTAHILPDDMVRVLEESKQNGK